MKFQTNFTFPLGKLAPALAASAWGGFFLALLLGFCMVWTGARERGEIPALEKQLKESQAAPQAKPSGLPQPSEGELSGLKIQLRDFNALSAGSGEPAFPTLVRLESLLPPGVRLASFQQDQQTGQIQLVAEAFSLETLSQFLTALEGDGGFTGVNLVKQGRGGQDNLIQFSVEMGAHS